MSYKHINAVLELDLEPACKSIMFALANFADEQGTSFPSYQTISKITGYARASVIRGIKKLCAEGFLVKENRIRETGADTSNVYTINLEIEVKVQKKPVHNEYAEGLGGGITVIPGGVSQRYPGGYHSDTPIVNHHYDPNTGINNYQDKQDLNTNNTHKRARDVRASLDFENDDFSKFWTEYSTLAKGGQKGSKAYAYKMWQKLKLTDAEKLEISDALRYQYAERTAMATAGAFVAQPKHASTWLSQKCWLNERIGGQELRSALSNTLAAGRVMSASERSKLRLKLSAQKEHKPHEDDGLFLESDAYDDSE